MTVKAFNIPMMCLGLGSGDCYIKDCSIRIISICISILITLI